MPLDPTAHYDGYYHCSPECWKLYTEILGHEYSDWVLYGQVHQLSVDSYAVQHAGGPHPDKSVAIHLSGLYLVLEQGLSPVAVPARLQRIDQVVGRYPHFPPPAHRGRLTVFSVALTGSSIEHAAASRAWARAVWQAWRQHHAAIADFVGRMLA